MLNINFQQLTIDLLPPLLRTTQNIEWMNARLFSFYNDVSQYYDFQNSTWFAASCTSQYMSFSYYLTTLMGFSVTVTEGTFGDPTYIYYNSEIIKGQGAAVYLFFNAEITSVPQEYTYYNTEFSATNNSFYVVVESGNASTENLNKIFSLVEQMKLGGTSWVFRLI